jgi:hypothetical protein
MAEKEQVLIAEEGHEGKYVALRSLVNRTVVASGDEAEAVMEQARQKGIREPFIFYVPEHNISLVYYYAY